MKSTLAVAVASIALASVSTLALAQFQWVPPPSDEYIYEEPAQQPPSDEFIYEEPSQEAPSDGFVFEEAPVENAPFEDAPMMEEAPMALTMQATGARTSMMRIMLPAKYTVVMA